MTDDLERLALADDLAARLRFDGTHTLWLKAIDRAMGADEGVRGGDSFGRRWERRIATGPGDVDRSWHLAGVHPSGMMRTLCNGSWRLDDPTDTVDNPPIPERCTACWRAAVQGNPLALALIDACDEIQAEERAKEGLREQARDEMVPRRTLTADARRRLGERRDRAVVDAIAARPDLYRAPTVHIGLPGDNWGGDPIVVDDPDAEFAVDQHLTRLDPTPEVIALCEQPRDRDEELEVDLRFDVSDTEEPVGVQMPDYDFEGGAG